MVDIVRLTIYNGYNIMDDVDKLKYNNTLKYENTLEKIHE
jgi:hypothetical protein